jgi:hypothetical protein
VSPNVMQFRLSVRRDGLVLKPLPKSIERLPRTVRVWVDYGHAGPDVETQALPTRLILWTAPGEWHFSGHRSSPHEGSHAGQFRVI